MSLFASVATFAISASAQTDPYSEPPSSGLSDTFNPAPMNTFTGNTSIAVAVHGFNSNPASWATGFLADDANQAPNWDTWAFDWSQDAAPIGFNVSPAQQNVLNAYLQGQYLAKTILTNGYEQVHLYGHSLGGRVIDTVATILSQAKNAPVIQTTFLDPFTPFNWNAVYGSTSTFSDEAVAINDLADTNAYLSNAFVTASGPQVSVFNPGSYTDAHAYPYQWYDATITSFNAAKPAYSGLGYNLSLEQGAANWPAGNPARGVVDVMNQAGTGIAGVTSIPKNTSLNTQNFNPGIVGAYTAKSSDRVTVGNNLITMNATGDEGTDGPEWINLAFNTTQPINFIDFKFDFTTSIDGELSMRLDNTLLWDGLDEYALTNQFEDTGPIMWTGPTNSLVLNTYQLAPGNHILSFRLDTGSFDQPSSVEISDINAGFVFVPEPTCAAILIAAGLLALRRRASN